MRVTDIAGVYQATAIAELERLLMLRIDECYNSFWISQDNTQYPTLSILVKNELATLHFMANEFEAGCRSMGGIEHPDTAGHSVFSISRDSGDDVTVTNDAIVPFADALSAAKEFFETGALPQCIKWLEL